MKILVLDTNVFLQCKDLKMLPWVELFAEKEHLLLLIPATVCKEIDQFKNDGNSRRARRARTANSLMKQLIESDHLTIRDSRPAVEISFVPLPSSEYHPPGTLDQSLPDNRIIGEILKYTNDYPDQDVSLLTHDTLPLLTARRHGVPYIQVPDTWLLEPEPDARDKKIAELQEELKVLQSTRPLIEIHAEDGSGNRSERFSVQVTRYRALTKDEIDALVAEVKRLYPMKEFPVETPPGPLLPREYPTTIAEHISVLGTGVRALIEATKREIPPSKEAIEKYQNHEYPAWIERVKEYIGRLPMKLEGPARKVFLTLIVNNNGSVPAENTIVELSIQGEAFFVPPQYGDRDEAELFNPIFPVPPTPPVYQSPYNAFTKRNHAFDSPQFRDFSRFDNFKSLGSLLQRPDRNDFHFKSGEPKKPRKERVFECEEFRHQMEAHFPETVFILHADQKSCTVSCAVSASNLPRQVEMHVKFDITYVDGDTLGEARKHIFASRDR